MDKVTVIFIIVMSFLFGFLIFMPFIDTGDFLRANEKDVIEHLGISIVQSNQVPQGQTIKFSLGEFKSFLQFIDMRKPTIIYDVPVKLSILPFAQGEYLYFINNSIIYFYG